MPEPAGNGMAELNALIARVAAFVHADPRVAAAWLEGSVGRGDADRYSDVDLHVLLADPPTLEQVEASMEAWLGPLGPFAGVRKVFGSLYHAVTLQGERLDVYLHTGALADVNTSQIRVLKTAPSLRRADPLPAPVPNPPNIAEFWRVTMLLPVALGRGEFVLAYQGIGFKLGVLSDLLVQGRGMPLSVGVKKLNQKLLPADRIALEHALAVPALDATHLARADLRLAALMHEYGPACCDKIGLSYPRPWEQVALLRLHRDLPQLGLEPVLQEVLGF